MPQRALWWVRVALLAVLSHPSCPSQSLQSFNHCCAFEGEKSIVTLLAAVGGAVVGGAVAKGRG